MTVSSLPESVQAGEAVCTSLPVVPHVPPGSPGGCIIFLDPSSKLGQNLVDSCGHKGGNRRQLEPPLQ